MKLWRKHCLFFSKGIPNTQVVRVGTSPSEQKSLDTFAKSSLLKTGLMVRKLQIPQHKLFTWILQAPYLHRLAQYRQADKCGGIHMDSVSWETSWQPSQIPITDPLLEMQQPSCSAPSYATGISFPTAITLNKILKSYKSPRSALSSHCFQPGINRLGEWNLWVPVISVQSHREWRGGHCWARLN